jgi:hypothetical protein
MLGCGSLRGAGVNVAVGGAGKLIPLSEKRYQFPLHNTKWLKNGNIRNAILSAFYNVSQRNFGIILIVRCSFKLWWNFCLDLSRSKLCSLGNRSIGTHILSRTFLIHFCLYIQCSILRPCHTISYRTIVCQRMKNITHTPVGVR